jgi:hypothetical protein
VFAPVYGTVITTGDQVAPAFGFAAAQVGLVVPQVYPHIGTVCPSGSKVLLGAAVRLTTDWARDAPLASRRTEAARLE